MTAGTDSANAYLVSMIRSDANALGMELFEYDETLTGGYRVSVYVGGGDFHYYRQHADGGWSHKAAGFPVTDQIRSDGLFGQPAFHGGLLGVEEDAKRGGYDIYVGDYYIAPY
jgi:hypothetical protein